MRSGKKTNTIQALLAAGALALAQPAVADTIQLAGWWAGSGSATITFAGTNYHTGSFTSLTESGGAGGFRTNDLTTHAASFQSWCVDIFHNFSFPAQKEATLNTAASIFGATKADDLGRLYTNHHTLIDAQYASTNLNEAAFQLAVWEIVNENPGNTYSLSGINGGAFKATGTGADLAQQWLNELNNNPHSASLYSAKIWSMQNNASVWGPQDVAIFTPVPEPQTYLLLVAGLALLWFGVPRKQLQSAA